MNKLKCYSGFCLVLLIALLSLESYGQGVTQVVDATVSGYQGTSYEAYHSVTLTPGFTFTPNGTQPYFYASELIKDKQPDDPTL